MNRQYGIITPGETGIEWHDGDPSLEDMQEAVGGLVDVLRITHDVDLWFNDEGLITGLPLGAYAAMGNMMDDGTMFGTPLFGPVVITSHDKEGETLGLTPKQRDRVHFESGLVWVDSERGEAA